MATAWRRCRTRAPSTLGIPTSAAAPATSSREHIHPFGDGMALQRARTGFCKAEVWSTHCLLGPTEELMAHCKDSGLIERLCHAKCFFKFIERFGVLTRKEERPADTPLDYCHTARMICPTE